jgi:hypothetical protein
MKDGTGATIYFCIWTRGIANRLDDAGLKKAGHREILIEALTWWSRRDEAIWPSPQTLANALPHGLAAVKAALKAAVACGLLAEAGRQNTGQMKYLVTPKLRLLLRLPEHLKQAGDPHTYATTLAEQALGRELTQLEIYATWDLVDAGHAPEAAAKSITAGAQ